MAQGTATAKDAKKTKKTPGRFFKRIGQFFKDLKSEAKKIVWPTKKQVINNTIVVIIVIVIIGAFVWGLDVLLKLVVDAILQNA